MNSINQLSYLIVGNRSETIPLKSFKSSDKNFGTFTSLIARKQISSCESEEKMIKLTSCILCLVQAQVWCIEAKVLILTTKIIADNTF